MHNDNQSEDLSALFGLEELPEEERETFLADIGSTLLEGAVLNFLLTLDEAGQQRFQLFLARAGEGEMLLEALAREYPEFVTVLDAEMMRFREEAKRVLGAGELV